MPKYLVIGSYTAQGAKGVMKDGGTARREAARRAIESVGGTLESFYFGFGKDDVYLVYDAPSHAAASSVTLTVAAAGGFAARTVVLIMPDEIDEAARMSPDYTPPGG